MSCLLVYCYLGNICKKITLLCRENGPFNIYIYSVLVIYHILPFSTLHFVILVYANLVAFHYFNPCRYYTVGHAPIMMRMGERTSGTFKKSCNFFTKLTYLEYYRY